MTEIIIQIPSEISDRLINGFANAFNYEENLFNSESGLVEKNTLSKVDFMKNHLLRIIKESALQAEINQAIDQAKELTQNKAINDFNFGG